MTYTFGITPGDGDPSHASQPRAVTVQINENQFDNNTNQASNQLQFQYDPTAASSSTATSTPAATSTPVVAITGGPADGSTIASGSDADFTFTVSDPSAFVACTLNSGSYGCSSPQDFTGLPDGSYVFSVSAGNSFGTSLPAVVNFSRHVDCNINRQWRRYINFNGNLKPGVYSGSCGLADHHDNERS